MHLSEFRLHILRVFRILASSTYARALKQEVSDGVSNESSVNQQKEDRRPVLHQLPYRDCRGNGIEQGGGCALGDS